MAEKDKSVLDPLDGVIGGLTGHDGKYPLKERRREQGYDVDAVPDRDKNIGTTETADKEVTGEGEDERNLTDPPGQPIADSNSVKE